MINSIIAKRLFYSFSYIHRDEINDRSHLVVPDEIVRLSMSWIEAMNNTDYDRTVRFDINGCRSIFSLLGNQESRAQDENIKLIISLIPITDLGSLPIKNCYIDVHASNSFGYDQGFSQGVGVVAVNSNGLAIRAMMSLDAAWQVASAIEAEAFCSVVVNLGPLRSVGDEAVLRSIEFRSD